MSTKTIKIGNMCCDRCIVVVKQVLDRNHVAYKRVELGGAIIFSESVVDIGQVEKDLKNAGFELLVSKEDEICEGIKIAIHRIFVEPSLDPVSINLRSYLEGRMNLPYKKLTELFSRRTKTTIEKYFILHRIEKVKALIEDTGSSFTEIAFKLGYNSLSHLSRQFKEIEGISMQSYKQKPKTGRKSIDRL